MICSSSFVAVLESDYQTVWISDQVKCFVGLDLDPDCLQMPIPWADKSAASPLVRVCTVCSM